MRFFNVDRHVSVIEDVAVQLRALGHSVESHLLSGLHWALGRPRAARGSGATHAGKVGYGCLNLDTVESFLGDYPDYAAASAWRRVHPELASFDGFIVTYPPSFALLYEGLPGRVVLDAPVRYDFGFTGRPEVWRDFNERLQRMQGEGRLVPVANSRYDAAYFTHFTGIPCHRVSSTCDYVDRLSPKWSPRGRKLLAFGDRDGCRAAAAHCDDVLYVRDVLPRYEHAEVAMARGVVWIPYNCSIMSFFEHYWLGIPLYVPTERFLVELEGRGLALSELTWHASRRAGSVIEAAVGSAMPDPHTEDGLRAWMPLYDFYDDWEFPHVVRFDSWQDLREKIEGGRAEEQSAAILAHNVGRRARNLEAWRGLVDWR